MLTGESVPVRRGIGEDVYHRRRSLSKATRPASW